MKNAPLAQSQVENGTELDVEDLSNVLPQQNEITLGMKLLEYCEATYPL